MVTVAANHLADIAALMVEKRTDRKKKTIWGDRRKRPFYYWLEALKKATGLSGTKITHTLKFDADIPMTTWRGDVTLPEPAVIHNHITVDSEYANFFHAYKIIHDHYKQLGITVLPNGREQSLAGRARTMSGAEYEMLKNKVVEDIESGEDSWERKMDLAMHKQGTGPNDIVGLNGIVPPALIGNFAGHSRAEQPLLHHLIFAGGAGGLGGTDYLGPSLTYGTNGTLVRGIGKVLRVLRSRTAMSELPNGNWKVFAGAGFIEHVGDEYLRLGQPLQMASGRKARGKVDMVLLDEDIQIGALDIIYDPTIDLMDSVASSERGYGLSAGTVAFSGGAGSGAQAVVYVSAAGAITGVTLTRRGSGYTSAPSVAVSGLGGGSGATFQAYIYSASSGAGLVQVAADDVRIGQVAYVAVTAAGSGYTASSLLNFTDCAYFLYEPAWEFLYQEGMDKYLSIPADQPRKRSTEVQCDATYFLRTLFNQANGLVHAKAA